MEDFPKLETERLVLSQVVSDDISNIAAYANLPYAKKQI